MTARVAPERKERSAFLPSIYIRNFFDWDING